MSAEVEMLRRAAAGIRDDVADPNNNRFPDEDLALAVAGLLDHAAGELEDEVRRIARFGDATEFLAALYEPSLKVARAYLGEA